MNGSPLKLNTEDKVTAISNKFKNHPIIKKSKSNYFIKEKIPFNPVTVKDTENIIRNIPTNKVTWGEVTLNIFKKSGLLIKCFKTT